MKDRVFYLDNEFGNINFVDLSKKLRQINYNYYGTGRRRLLNAELSVSDYPVLESILKLFVNPELILSFEIMTVEYGNIVVPHIDAGRKCCINIPILGDFENTFIGFHENTSDDFLPNVYYEADGSKTISSGGGFPNATLIDKISYSKPIILNTTKIHNVINLTKQDRTILSITFKYHLHFNEIVNLHKNHNLFLHNKNPINIEQED